MGKKTPEKIVSNITPKIADESKPIKKSSSKEAGQHFGSKQALQKGSVAISATVSFEEIPKQFAEIKTHAIRRLINAI